MRNSEYLLYDQPNGATTSFIVGNTVIPAPAYFPEIKGDEDLKAMMRASSALPLGNPVIVPSNRWMHLISNPILGPKGSFGPNSINGFLEDHPIVFYDPPEFFRYTLGGELVKYALKGDREKKQQFYGFLKKGELDSALEIAHPFFRPFIQRQLQSLLSTKNIVKEPVNSSSHVERAWLDSKIDESYAPYVYEIVAQALKMPSAVLIPPVPPLTKTSESSYATRVLSSNQAAYLICRRLSERTEPISGMEVREVLPYFHLYLDWSIIQDRQGIDTVSVLRLLEDGLERGNFAGVAVSIAGYEAAAKNQRLPAIEHLINEIVNISHQAEGALPVVLPRSGWYGLSLTDVEIQAFGGLLNGKYQYTSGGGGTNPEDRYGKVPLIDACSELRYNEVKEHLRLYGEFPSVPNLSRKPSHEELANPTLYRERWAKPMRLIHIEEARRLRAAKSKGIQSPARRYFEKSKHVYLSAYR